ncbi:hypothetical protein YC2023_067245 [Brassica napus]
MKTMISNLPVDLLEEILSRVMLKSIGAVRSTCKNWNVLSKDERFANKHIEKTAASQRDKEVLVITVNTKDDLISVKFYDFHKKNRNGILITREKSDQVVSVRHVFYCNGLLLCIWKGNDKRRLLTPDEAFRSNVVTARSPGVRQGLSKGRYGHVSTHLDNPTCPVTGPESRRAQNLLGNTVTPTSIYFYLQSCVQGNGNGGVSNKLLSEVALDLPARMTLYTTLCGN